MTDLPQFVTVRGGAYFFMPGLSALRYLAALGINNRLSVSLRSVEIMDQTKM